MTSASRPPVTEPCITASWPSGAGERRFRLSAAFCVGCDAAGDLQVDDQRISRAWAAVFLRDGRWWIRDLGCPGGLVLNGAPTQTSPLPPRAALVLGRSGLSVVLEADPGSGSPQRATGAAVPAHPDDGRTRLHAAPHRPAPAATVGGSGVIRVQVAGQAAPREFAAAVRIGRDPSCALQVDDDGVSRAHAEIFPLGGQWWVRDLGSSNGTYLDGQRIVESALPNRGSLRLGADGPTLELSHAAAAPGPSPSATPRSIEEVASHYFDPDSKAPAGDRTMWVRRAYSTIQRKQKRRYGSVIAGIAGLLLVAVAIGVFQYLQLQRTRGLAEQLFYNMKAVELQLVRLEDQVLASGDTTHDGELRQGRAQLAEMASQYDALLEELGVLGDDLPAEDRLILRMARVFGECEIAMPGDFVQEVKRYIGIWRSNDRLAKALGRAHQQGLPEPILRTLAQHHMLPQFFYVALQESDFRPQAVGPQTRFGIAKGLWQLMPETAIHYGLSTGPLLDLPEYDPADQRFDAVAATGAAARYLADLYRGEAQASGLLVLASYNWGTTRVRNHIRAMKENPRDRNFWRLLAQTDMPKETRDYVLLIFSAAVIGEDPRLFGFDFERPLAPAATHAERH